MESFCAQTFHEIVNNSGLRDVSKARHIFMQATWKTCQPSARNVRYKVKSVNSTHKSSLVRSRSQWIIHEETTSVLMPLSLVEYVIVRRKEYCFAAEIGSDENLSSQQLQLWKDIFCILLKAASVATT